MNITLSTSDVVVVDVVVVVVAVAVVVAIAVVVVVVVVIVIVIVIVIIIIIIIIIINIIFFSSASTKPAGLEIVKLNILLPNKIGDCGGKNYVSGKVLLNATTLPRWSATESKVSKVK